jgi:hypothetical protein
MCELAVEKFHSPSWLRVQTKDAVYGMASMDQLLCLLSHRFCWRQILNFAYAARFLRWQEEEGRWQKHVDINIIDYESIM